MIACHRQLHPAEILAYLCQRRAQPHRHRWHGLGGGARRSLATGYVRAAAAADAPAPAPYPVQRGLTQAMREAAARENNVAHMQAWSGQAGRLAPSAPAAGITERWWGQAKTLL